MRARHPVVVAGLTHSITRWPCIKAAS